MFEEGYSVTKASKDVLTVQGEEKGAARVIMDLHHGWHRTSFSFVTAADRIFRTNQNKGPSTITNVRRESHHFPRTRTGYGFKAGRGGPGPGARACSVNRVGFRSEVRVKKSSVCPTLWAHRIFFSFPFPLLPLKYKTKSTPTPSPDLKKCSHAGQNPHICPLCPHSAEAPESRPMVTRKETGCNIQNSLCPGIQTHTPHSSPSS